MEIAGSRVLLTGAAGGLGRQLAAQLAARGAELILTDTDSAALETLGQPYGARTVAADLTEDTDLARLADTAAEADVVLVNHALPATGPLGDYTGEDVARTLRCNLTAAVQLARLLTPGMVARGRGRFVCVGSIAGEIATGGTTLYSAAKFGLRGFTRSLRHDLRGTGVGVSLVEPTFLSDVGMLVDSGAPVPRSTGGLTAAQVATHVLEAISRDREQVLAAPPAMRALLRVCPGRGAEALLRRVNSPTRWLRRRRSGRA